VIPGEECGAEADDKARGWRALIGEGGDGEHMGRRVLHAPSEFGEPIKSGTEESSSG
jgi:hypothetical protein